MDGPGAFWKDSEDHSQNQQVANYIPGPRDLRPLPAIRCSRCPANARTTDLLEEYALFGEVSYDLTDRLEATVGLRYFRHGAVDFSNTASGTDDSPVSPKFVLSWRPTDNLLLYFNYATGFRPGNVNNHMAFNYRQLEIQIQAAAAFGIPPLAHPAGGPADLSVASVLRLATDVESYELGLKTTLWDGPAYAFSRPRTASTGTT